MAAAAADAGIGDIITFRDTIAGLSCGMDGFPDGNANENRPKIPEGKYNRRSDCGQVVGG
jgi:hypothetical protein